MTTTVARGNTFRDAVSSLLEAAGYHVKNETRIHHKKVDIQSWIKLSIDGPVQYAIEAKDYSHALNMANATEFKTQYGAFLEDGSVDRAWLVSKGSITPDARKLIDGAHHKTMRCFTFAELQREIFNISTYLTAIQNEYASSDVEKYYIPPKINSSDDLLEYVSRWIDDLSAPPLALVGGYGQGKSTFALHLAAKLAHDSELNPAARTPLLVRLGQIINEQSLDGLFGKLFTSQYRVEGYHFDLFNCLNRNGRFVIIFDGFDEMKHGMTPAVFERNISQLLSLDREKAKILLLGRDTAFHDDHEFRAVILGRQITAGGKELSNRDRRALIPVELQSFSLEDAHKFVGLYFPIKAQDAMRREGVVRKPDWHEQVLEQLLSGSFDHLLVRPVHAQMLCEIAAYNELSVFNTSRFELYDAFVHYLLDREVRKEARYPGFDGRIRRTFNTKLAWWLWKQGGSGTTSISDIPQEICAVPSNVEHDFDPTGLKRELVAGCLVEKSGGTVYFGHRSIQEFLVSEFLWDNDFLLRQALSRPRLGDVFRLLNNDIIQFIVERSVNAPDGVDKAKLWLESFAASRTETIPLQVFELGRSLMTTAALAEGCEWESPFLLWLRFFYYNRAATFKIRHQEAADFLRRVVRQAISYSSEQQAAALYLLASVLMERGLSTNSILCEFLIRWFPVDRWNEVSRSSGSGRTGRIIVEQGKDLYLWSFLRSVQSVRVELVESFQTTSIDQGRAVSTTRAAAAKDLVVDVAKVLSDMLLFLGFGIEAEYQLEPETRKLPAFSCSAKQIYDSIGKGDKETQRLKAMREFVNNDNFARRIAPIIVKR